MTLRFAPALFVVVTAYAQAQPALPVAPAPQITAHQIAPEASPSTITIASESEPGVPMIISGRITDGARPIQNASVFVYHTDVEGYYANRRSDNGDEARLRGAMRTDAQGRYEYRTIRPGSYANSRFPAHAHYVVHADGYQDVVTEFNFDDDPFMNDPGQREFAASRNRPVIKMSKDPSGAWRGVFDLNLTKAN